MSKAFAHLHENLLSGIETVLLFNYLHCYLKSCFFAYFLKLCHHFANFLSEIFVVKTAFHLKQNSNMHLNNSLSSERLYSSFIVQKTAFVRLVALTAFTMPLDLASSILHIYAILTMQSTLLYRNSILLGIIVCIYWYIGRKAVVNRNILKSDYNIKKAEKDAFCKHAMDNFEVSKANSLESQLINAFTPLIKAVSLKRLKYHILSENYRLLTRLSILILKFSFVFLRLVDSEISLGEVLHRIYKLNTHLLQLRNSLFLVFEYWKECDFNEKDTNSDNKINQPLNTDIEPLSMKTGIQKQYLGSRCTLPVILKRDSKTLIFSKYETSNILVSLLGFGSAKYDVTIGGISFNSSSVQSLVSFMPGTQYIFSNSISFNLLYGTSLSQAQLEERLAFFGFLSYFNQFQNGLETLIDSKTIGISSGQRQVICFLRCILKEAPFYILDEPTIFLDKETEKKVYNLIGSIKDSTVVVASKSNLYNACFDHVITLDS